MLSLWDVLQKIITFERKNVETYKVAEQIPRFFLRILALFISLRFLVVEEIDFKQTDRQSNINSIDRPITFFLQL